MVRSCLLHLSSSVLLYAQAMKNIGNAKFNSLFEYSPNEEFPKPSPNTCRYCQLPEGCAGCGRVPHLRLSPLCAIACVCVCVCVRIGFGRVAEVLRSLEAEKNRSL